MARSRELGVSRPLIWPSLLGPLGRWTNRPKLSVIVAAFNMDRVLPRTLKSLSADYQRGVTAGDYEIILIDNGSTPPIQPDIFDGLTGQFRLIRIDDAPKSPAFGINAGAKVARGDLIGVMIDGGRLATPGLIHGAISGMGLYPNALVATLGWYVGYDLQGRAMDGGYNPAREDKLLADICWPDDGYRLFEIGTFDESSLDGWFYPINESNSLFMTAKRFKALGGLDEAFDAPGGGLVNLDFFARAASMPDQELVVLLGEATFHQVHGGISTNAPLSNQESNWERWHGQYVTLRGHDFHPPNPKRTYLGRMPQAVLQRAARALAAPSFPRAPAEAMGQKVEHALGRNFDPVLWQSEDEKFAPPADPVLAELLATAQYHFTQGAGATAREIARLVLDLAPDDREAQRIICLTAQDRLTAETLGLHHAAIGDALLKLGRRDLALAALHLALEIDSDCTSARWTLAHLQLPGPNYLDLLARLHDWLTPKLYLEIGVFEGTSIALAKPPTRAVGIDPAPKILHPLTASTLILPRTSDAQFALADPRADWGGDRIDFAFIDGLHVYDQVLRDFAFVEAHANRDALIAIHDTHPFDRLSAEPERVTQFHTGDVWRLIPFLSAHRPDLKIITVKAPPSGLTLIANLNPDFDWSTLLHEPVIAAHRHYDFDIQQNDPTGVLKLVENDWAEVFKTLAPILGRSAS